MSDITLRSLGNVIYVYHYIYDVMYCYCRAHIPRAVYFDLYKCCTGTKEIPLNLPDSECWTTYIQSLGVSSDTHVVVYDGQNMRLALRTWWLFRVGTIEYEVGMGRESTVKVGPFEMFSIRVTYYFI